jgi:hypothetical protein
MISEHTVMVAMGNKNLPCLHSVSSFSESSPFAFFQIGEPTVEGNVGGGITMQKDTMLYHSLFNHHSVL